MTKLYVYLLNLPTLLQNNEDGQDLIEYALLVALISIVAVVAIALAGGAVGSAFSNVASRITAAFN